MHGIFILFFSFFGTFDIECAQNDATADIAAIDRIDCVTIEQCTGHCMHCFCGGVWTGLILAVQDFFFIRHPQIGQPHTRRTNILRFVLLYAMPAH